MEVEPLDATFGAVVRDVRIAELSDEEWTEVHAAWLDRGLLVFPAQFITTDQQNDFARRFGNLEFEATPIANLGRDGTVHSDPTDDVVKSLRGNEGWHHDSTYMPLQAKGAVFSAEIIPSHGAATGFADMRAAYDALAPAEQERLAGLRASHSLYYSQGRAGYLPSKKDDGSYGQYGYHDQAVPLRPLVKVHPKTGRRNLLIGQHAHASPGLTAGESEALLDRLNDEACAAPRTYYHTWTEGDALLWDNRCLMHRATPHDPGQARRMWHTRIAGDPVTEAGLDH